MAPLMLGCLVLDSDPVPSPDVVATPFCGEAEENVILCVGLWSDTVLCLFCSSCEDIVRMRTQDRIASGDEMAEKELNDLQGLKVMGLLR